MNKIEFAIIITYLVINTYFCINWLTFNFRNPSDTPEDKFLSFIMFAIATIFWPLAIPFHFWEIIKTRKIELSSLIPVFLAMLTFSVLFYFR